MKRLSLLLSACAVLGICLAGCGAQMDEVETQTGAESSTPVDEYLSNDLPDIGVNEEDVDGEDAEGGQVHALGKWCNVSCSVVRVAPGWCPDTIGGSGRTTFLGGYNKACEKAQHDAASKLQPHCRIHTCSRF
jgi:hypothetical protein